MNHLLNICNINGAEVESVDIITFGAPCQDLSVAGKRSGLKHVALGDDETTRSGLFFEAIRIIKEMREATNGTHPRFAIYENVPGAFSSNKGHDFHAVLEALCSVCDDTVSIPKPYDKRKPDKLVWNKAGEIVGNGYSVAWRTLDAQYWGVPQRRKRIYLVADFTGGRAGEILFKPSSLRGDMPQGNEAGQETAADVVGSVDRSVGAAGVVSKGNGECFIMPECHMSLSVGGGQAGQGYPCTVYSFDSLSSNSMKSSNPFSGCRAVDVAKCIDTTYPDPSKNQGGVAVVECLGFDMYNQASTGDKTRTLKTPAGGDDLPVIALKERAGCDGGGKGALWSDKAFTLATNQDMSVIALQANGIDRADTAGCNGAGWRENESYTLNTVDRHAVCYGIDHVITTGGNCTAQGSCIYEYTQATLKAGGVHAVCYDARNHNAQNISGTIQAKSNGGQSLNYINPVCYDARENGETLCFNEAQITSPTNGNNPQWNEPCHTLSATDNRAPTVILKKPPRRYIIRRLLPVECARLQGFPDKWGHLAPYDPADAEFWENVRKTHAEINGKKYKPVKDLKKWYDKLHTDSAEYKMWGNGIALPNARYVLSGIAEQGAKTLGSLFDGSGGFPLAGVLNGITPLWASEVEPYPIAVTKSRFKEVQNG